MDLLDTSLSEKSLNPRQSELEMRDLVGAGSLYPKPDDQEYDVNETAQEDHVEVSVPNPNHTSVENMDTSDESMECAFLESSRPNTLRDGFDTLNVKSIEQKEIMGDENNARTSAETGMRASEFSGLEKVEVLSKDVALHSDGKVLEDSTSKTPLKDAGLLHDNGAAVLTIDNGGGALPFNATENLGLQRSEPVRKEAVNITAEVGLNGANTVRSRKRKSKLVPPENTRVLRSRSRVKAKACEPKAMGIEDSANETQKSRRGRKKGMKKCPINEFSSIRTRLRYLLHRINYEQNLIDAYSGEGWKGQSLEKIKPEKELQRARSQIFRCKLKIRDLFQRLDASLGQGKLPETLFDSEGQIDSEDIFCAKCGSKDLTLDNDIILCDGACERGFHQFCLEPPLLKEDVPPGDEGWLCPGCDCKDDCFDMLNDFQGSRLSVFDNWEKVFPEEAAAAALGKNMDDISSLQSEDSEDDDYNPDNKQPSQKASGDESSGKSDYFSASDVMVPAQNDWGLLGLPSDDSEDDDFNPSAPSDDQPAEHESSGSDFTSDSEDLGAILDKEKCVDEEGGCVSSISHYSKPNASAAEEKSTVSKVKGQSLGDELSYLLDTDVAPISGKRQVERLDYKKLHDETYGDATSDSSDEEYGEKTVKKRRKGSGGVAISGSIRFNRGRKRVADVRDGNDCLKGTEQALDEECHKSSEAQGSNNAYGKSETSSGVGSSGKNKRLGDAVSQRLLESFKENQYPKQEVRESLAREMGLRVQQVTKWFENARWSFRHTYRMESKIAQISGRNGTSPGQSNESTPKLESATVSINPSCSKVEETRTLQSSPEKECPPNNMEKGHAVPEANEQNSRILKSRVEKDVRDQSGNNASATEPTTNQNVPIDERNSRSMRKSSRLR